MHAKLTRELCKLAIIEEYQVSFLEYLMLDMPIMPGLLSFLLYLLMKSYNEAILFQLYYMHQPFTQSLFICHLSQHCNPEARYNILYGHDNFLSISQFKRGVPYQLLTSCSIDPQYYWNSKILVISVDITYFGQGMLQNIIKSLNYPISLRVIRGTLLMKYLKLLCKCQNGLI